MNAPARLIAHSEEVLIANRWSCLVTVCTDEFGRPWEVVFKARDKAGKSGSEIELLMADIGIATSRMLQNRPANNPSTEPHDGAPSL